jgi:ribonucleoside-diphosphate reductase alpha chain
MYEGIKTKDIHEVLIMVVRSMIERDPAHSFVAARLFAVYVPRGLGEDDYNITRRGHKQGFMRTIKRGVEIGQFDPRMLEFDLPQARRRLDRARPRL